MAKMAKMVKKAKNPAKKAAPKRRAPAASKKQPTKKATTAKPKPAPRAAAKPAVVARPGVASASTPAERRRQFPEALRLRGISVSLTASDLQKSLEFYVDGLGFTVKERWEKDGKLQGVMLIAGSCEIGLSQDDWAKGRDRAKGIGVSFFAETGQSLDLIAALARERGVAEVGPKLAPWGDRVVEFIDPDGFKFTIYWPK